MIDAMKRALRDCSIYIFIIGFVGFIALGFACETNPIYPKPAQISIEEVDVGATEVWLHYSVHTSELNKSFQLVRTSGSQQPQVVFSHATPNIDTIIHDVSLSPNSIYTYVSFQRAYGSLLIDSATIQVVTLDTSSHQFNFRSDTLGDGSSSELRDVFILNDSIIFAVGELNVFDTNGGFDRAYGLAINRGADWELHRLITQSPIINNINLRPLGVYAFSPTDVWFAGGSVFHWDGTTITPYWITSFPGNPGSNPPTWPVCG